MSNKTELAVDSPSPTPASELMHNQTAITVPGVDRPIHHTVDREEWVPEGMPTGDGQPVKTGSPLHYVEHVGRAGVLAAALGVGAAIAGTAGVASAAPAKADTTNSAPSTPSNSGTRAAGEHTTRHASRTADNTRENSRETSSSPSTRSAAGGRSADENTTRNDSRTDRTSNRESHSRSETRETKTADVGSDETATTEAADTPSETVEVASAPARDHAARSTATDVAPESAAAPATEQVVLISVLPEEQSPVADADITTTATPASAKAAVGQIQETVLAPLTVPASPTNPTVQTVKTPLVWKIFPWAARQAKTPTVTTAPAQDVAASRTATTTVASSTVASSTAAVVSSSVGIKVPASATVFTLRGRDVPGIPDDMSLQFGGVFNTGPYTATDLDYPIWSLDAIEAGVKILDASLMSTSGNIIVEGHSEGAQIISRWMRTYADDPTRAAMASRITFILTGNPLRAGGGKGIGMKEPDGEMGLATPTTTPYSVIDVARRYDRWADEPHTTNAWSIANSTSAMNSFHTDYTKVSLNDSTNTVWREGNTTYVLTFEKTLPLLLTVSKIAPADFVNAVRAKIEAGYTRVSSDSGSSANIPSVIKIKSRTWQAKFDKLVLQYGA